MAVTYQEEQERSEAKALTAEKIRRHYPVIYLIVFFVLLLAPWYGFSGNFADFPGRFFGRENLLRSFANFRYRVLGDQLYPSLIMGKNDWMIFTAELSLDDYQNTIPYTDEQLQVYQDRLDRFADRLNAKGIPFLMVVVPNKNTIYPEKMPPDIPVLGKISRLDQLVEYEKTHGKVKILDLRPALLEAKQERQIYYNADTHWNWYGSYVGYSEIMKALQKYFPNLQPHPLSDFRYVSDGVQEGDLSRMLGQVVIREEMFHMEPNFPRTATQQVLPMDNTNVIKIRSVSADSSLPRLVMYRDSFSHWLIDYLADHFSEATYIWDFQIDEKYIDQKKPDVVILECTERYLRCLNDIPQQ